MDEGFSIRLIVRGAIETAKSRAMYDPGPRFTENLEDLICNAFQKVTVYSETNVPEDVYTSHAPDIEIDMMERAAHALAREIVTNDKCRIVTESRKDKMRHVRKFKHTMTVVVVNEP